MSANVPDHETNPLDYRIAQLEGALQQLKERRQALDRQIEKATGAIGLLKAQRNGGRKPPPTAQKWMDELLARVKTEAPLYRRENAW